jgi:hypothetical protein
MANSTHPPLVTAQDPASQTQQALTTYSGQEMEWQPTTENNIVAHQYLWKHPHRAGRITLYSGRNGNLVSFSHLLDGSPVEDCPPHGSWERTGLLLEINFNHEANPEALEKHTFRQRDPNLDVWIMAGTFDGWNAKKFAFLQPWRSVPSM